MNSDFFSNLVDFAEAALVADYSRLRRVGQLLSREIESIDLEAARRFRSAINRKGLPLQASGSPEMLPIDNKSRLPLVEEHAWPTTPVFLSFEGQDLFQSFLADVSNFELLASKGVASKLSLLLSGPPGTGKTLLAGHVAAQLGRRLYVVRLDSVISSMLGDTAKNIRSIFDFVAGKDAVLFLDELDAVAKMRDDRNELGELKRVVNTVIQGIDSLDERAVVIAATNHPQMLDAAIWRRFSYKLELHNPNSDLRSALWANFLNEDESSPRVCFLTQISENLTGADIEHYAFSARRRAIISDQEIDYIRLAGLLLSRVEGYDILQEKSSDARRRLAQILVKNRGIGQSDVARFLGVSRQAVSSYVKSADA